MQLNEFAAYKQAKGRLKQFRTEAVRAGFSQTYKERDFATIIRVAERLPEIVVQEDPDLLMSMTPRACGWNDRVS